ncbi:hypothetical protein [Nostoc piscinale]|uniref:hypothetical protein n=1 Tax=Nostoc piscinale TaxID=224012 RepID=UPI0039A500F7
MDKGDKGDKVDKGDKGDKEDKVDKGDKGDKEDKEDISLVELEHGMIYFLEFSLHISRNENFIAYRQKKRKLKLISVYLYHF